VVRCSITLLLLLAACGDNLSPPGLDDFDAGFDPGEGCDGDKVTWKIAGYLDTRLSEAGMAADIAGLNSAFEDLGLSIEAEVTRIVPVMPGEEVPWDRGDEHVGMYFSPDNNGGYLGPPYEQIFAPLLPAGQGEFLSNVLVHEGLHFFGVQDLYTYPGDMLAGANVAMGTDVMVAPRQSPLTLHPIAKRVACGNIGAMREAGREAIHYPARQLGHPLWVKTRLATVANLSIRIPEGTRCEVYRSTYDGDTFTAGYEDDPVPDVEEVEGALTFPHGFFNWYHGFKVVCDVGQVYIPNLLLDKCFLEGGATMTSCSFDCSTTLPGGWCGLAD
jgi:hypothetical protein